MGIRLENVTKRFGNVVAVDNVNLEINEGELMVLLGPSGCGKTTTLRLIAGLERVTEGKIFLGDELVDDGGITHVRPKNRSVSMVFQSYALFPHLNVFGNIAFPARVNRRPRSEIKKRAHELAEMLEIEKLLHRKPDEISGGEAQRVALARALMLKPKLLLLDEPLANLDAKLRLSTRADLKRLHKEELKCTTVYVTHDQVEALSMADRVAVMKDGRILQVGTGDELSDRPRNTFVASFLGSPPMNMIDCTFDELNGRLDLGPFAIKVPKSWIEPLKGHRELIFGIRPGSITVHQEEGGIGFEVYVLEPLVEETILTLRREDVMIKTILPPDRRFRMGETAQVEFNLDKAYIFDRNTGEAIL